MHPILDTIELTILYNNLTASYYFSDKNLAKIIKTELKERGFFVFLTSHSGIVYNRLDDSNYIVRQILRDINNV